MITQSDIKILLTRWGQWSANGGQDIGNTGFKSIWVSLLPSTGCYGFGSSVDNEMLAVDSALCWLKEKNCFDYALLKLKYRYGYSYNRLAEHLTRKLPKYHKNNKKMHHKTAESYVDTAERTLLLYLQNNLAKIDN